PQPRRQVPTHAGRGPLIICLDTSGSMRDAPENVAKACVLQALRSAHTGHRPCRLLAFGGPSELLERDLTLDAAGLEHLLDLMGQSFDGGTDVQTPIERAIELVQTAGWEEADLLVVSDGEFGVTHATLQRLRDAKQRLALRAHGVLIGDRETIGLLEVCDHLYWVREWRRYGSGAATVGENFSPVHSRSLTAMYFPNAVRR
ncbi:VWA domain-containing protein, partial [Hydrogenophaga sp. A37]|uniref:vWA domain-containing protein n=1 Tax=Hydrogenophaga sp. A37 TaxID=1945864 RepID=UPI0009CC73E6